MSSRKEFTQRYQARVTEWRPKVDGLSLRLERLSPERRLDLQSHLDAVNSRFRSVDTHLDALHVSTDDAWDGVRASAERAWNEFKSAVEGAYTMLKASALDRQSAPPTYPSTPPQA